MTTSCEGCRDGAAFDLPITMAFHPIVDVRERRVFAHEALVRGADGQGAGAVLAQVSPSNRYAFDQKCRVKAIELASDLKLAADGSLLSINFLPNAVYEPRACIRLTLAAALRLLSEFQPDLVKLDMDLIRGLEKSSVKQTIVRNTLTMLRELGVTPICEGVETIDEFQALRDLGVDLMQGYLFSKPGLAALPVPIWPEMAFEKSRVAV